MQPVQNVVVAVDLGNRAGSVIREALRLASGAGPAAELVLVHVVHDLASMLGVYMSGKPLPDLQAELEEEGRARLRALLEQHVHGAGMHGRAEMLTGVPWSEIVGAAIHHRADLIVMGAHTDAKPEHKIYGSTVSRVLRQAPCSVVVVPPDDPD